ncbi:DedA family protein [Nonomuraea sp. CA-141351]|uniref:DedA family protein n=1 Tax=Nonomuraea sp. CA-141351 TaxID=3239996 RepID=UPI003D9167F3
MRTVLNPLAGAVKVPARTFTLWQIIGGLLWTVGLVLTGYALGSSITGVDRYLLPLVGAVVAVSLLPLALEILRSRRRSRTTTRSAQRQAHR